MISLAAPWVLYSCCCLFGPCPVPGERESSSPSSQWELALSLVLCTRLASRYSSRSQKMDYSKSPRPGLLHERESSGKNTSGPSILSVKPPQDWELSRWAVSRLRVWCSAVSFTDNACSLALYSPGRILWPERWQLKGPNHRSSSCHGYDCFIPVFPQWQQDTGQPGNSTQCSPCSFSLILQGRTILCAWGPPHGGTLRPGWPPCVLSTASKWQPGCFFLTLGALCALRRLD